MILYIYIYILMYVCVRVYSYLFTDKARSLLEAVILL